MVVALDDETKNAKLSLRQTEILAKLSSIVNIISSETADSYVEPFSVLVSQFILVQYIGTHLSSGIWTLHVGIYTWFAFYWIHHRFTCSREEHAL